MTRSSFHLAETTTKGVSMFAEVLILICIGLLGVIWLWIKSARKRHSSGSGAGEGVLIMFCAGIVLVVTVIDTSYLLYEHLFSRLALT